MSNKMPGKRDSLKRRELEAAGDTEEKQYSGIWRWDDLMDLKGKVSAFPEPCCPSGHSTFGCTWEETGARCRPLVPTFF
jgi:hypothetical protein